jgi:murein DD-endopeptidase MepM/ murein hydrolase activator NlpD
MAAKAQEVEDLRAVNVKQKKHIAELTAQMEDLQAQVAELDELDQQLRQMLDMDLGYGKTTEAVIASGEQNDAETDSLGVGGGQAPNIEPISDQVQSNDKNTNALRAVEPSLQDAAGLQAAAASLSSKVGVEKDSLKAVRGALQDQLTFLMARPTGWPARGIITSGFGWRKSPYTWGQEFHEGLDIAAPSGTPIHATADGTVKESGWRSGYGRVVTIRHGFGFATFYAHNTRNAVSVGDKISRGDIVAYIGNTGRSTGPHLHYEVRRYGRKLDPRGYLEPPKD